MPRYKIDPHGVEKTLKATGKDAGEFEKDLKPLDGNVQALAAACGNSGAIVPALSGLFDHEGKQLTAMGKRVKACITGAAAATTAYVQGDLAMMQTYQTNASQAKVSVVPKAK